VADVGDSETVVAAVEHGKATLGIASRRVAAPWAEYQLFATDRLVLVVPPEHAWKKLRRVTVEQLRTEPIILREPGSGTRACLERALATRNLTLADLKVCLEVGSNDAVKDAVSRRLGVAVLSIRAVQPEISVGRLHEVPIEGVDLTRELYIVTDHVAALDVATAVRWQNRGIPHQSTAERRRPAQERSCPIPARRATSSSMPHRDHCASGKIEHILLGGSH
jgi:DNA-binding transcriptional LysR family regulator